MESQRLSLPSTKFLVLLTPFIIFKSVLENSETYEFFTIGLSDAFLSDYLTDLKLYKTK